ncbi:MAG TPA: ABC transporter ATP-binding protein [Stellaceae bacterium]|nr:ABC transporter ATP-binding protein [Stellaceae bacterium]
MLRRLLPFLAPYRWRFLFALLQVFLMAGFELLKPWPLQVVIDDVLGGKRIGLTWLQGWSPSLLLLVSCLALVAVNLGSGLLTLLYNMTTIGVGQRMVNDLRGALMGQLHRLSLAFHSRQKVGDLMYRVTADSFAVQTMIMNGALPILSATILLAGMIAVLVPIDAMLTAISLTVVPALFVLIALFNRKITTVATEVRERESVVYSLVQWAMNSIKVVQAFTKEEEEHRRFMGASGASLKATLRLYGWQTLYSALVNGVIAAGTALVVYAGASAALGGRLSIGQLIVFISYLAQLYAPVNQITQSWGLIAGARVGARRCFEVLDVETDLKDGPRSFPLEGAKGAVEWRQVSFRYRPETPVLRNVDLAIAPGTKVALVGPTGAGKSTLLGMLPRFFDPDEGTVLVDGVDARDYQLASLRRQLSMVLQPPLLFPLSIKDNIAYGRPGADDSEIERAARLARIHEMVAKLPQGYDTVIGDGAGTLSEGEKQRLTIARAILRDAPILILDEPTSALDVETEALVMEGIRRLTEGRTTFTIAHRLSTVRDADLILVLRDGTIVERGSFAELLRRGGAFADLYNTQFKGAA